LKLIVTKSIVKRTKFSDIIVKMAKVILVAKVKEELKQGEFLS
jgi:microcompartment protein CcmL/EutN